jgi:hypothetical protein
MRTEYQSSHLAGKRHMTRTQQIRRVTGESRGKEMVGLDLTNSDGPVESSNTSGGTGQLSSTSTPATRNKQNSRSTPPGPGSSGETTHNPGIVRSKTRERGTQTSNGPVAVPASHTASRAQSFLTIALPAFEFTAEEIAKPMDFVTAYGCFYVLVWECKPCNRWMPLSSKPAHLVCASHVERVLQSFTVSPSVVTQEQNSPGGQASTCDVGELQASNLMMNSSRSSPLASQQVNSAGTQSGVHQQASRTSKPKSTKLQRNSHKPQSFTPQMGAHKTATASSKTGSISESAARFWTCPHCRTVLAMHQKAAHHCVRPGPSTQAPTIGPLDRFFHSFPSYPYDACKSPDVSFSRLLSGLSKWHTWDHKNPNTWELYRKQVKEEYQTALTHEFNLYFGTEDDIVSWHALCRAVRVQPPPLTCEDCQSVSSQTLIIVEDRDGKNR